MEIEKRYFTINELDLDRQKCVQASMAFKIPLLRRGPRLVVTKENKDRLVKGVFWIDEHNALIKSRANARRTVYACQRHLKKMDVLQQKLTSSAIKILEVENKLNAIKALV